MIRSPGRTLENGISAPAEEAPQRWLALGPLRPRQEVPREEGPQGPCCSPPPPRTSSLRNGEKLNTAARKVPRLELRNRSPSVCSSIASGLRSGLGISFWKCRPAVHEVGLRSKGRVTELMGHSCRGTQGSWIVLSTKYICLLIRNCHIKFEMQIKF